MPWNPSTPGATSQQDNQTTAINLGGGLLVSGLLPSAARTTTTNSAAQATGNADNANILIDVTAVSGTTPTLTVEVQWSHDGTTWFSGGAGVSADATASITAVGKLVRTFPVRAPFMRVQASIAGTTPSFTFAVHVYLQD